jgi:hypothetical protein
MPAPSPGPARGARRRVISLCDGADRLHAGLPQHGIHFRAEQRTGRVTDCGCGYDDCSACAGYGWACLQCELAFFGTAPGHGLCPGCLAGGAA